MKLLTVVVLLFLGTPYTKLCSTIFEMSQEDNKSSEIDNLKTATSFNPLIEKVMRHNMSSIEWEDEEWPNEGFYDYIMRCMRFQKNPTTAKKRRTAFNLLQSAQKGIDIKQGGVLDDGVTWDDLHLFRGDSKSPTLYLADKICRTSTEMGKVFFFSMLAQPQSSIAKIEKRQRMVKELLERKDLFEFLEERSTR